MLLLDAGGSLAPREHISSADLPQRRIKADLVAEAWALGGLDALAISADDWGLGRETIDALAHQYHLPVLAANLECDEPYPGALLIERGGLRIGVVGVTAGDPKGCTVGKPGPAAILALEALGPVDITVALVPLSGEALKAFASDGPPVDLLIGMEDDSVPRIAGRGFTIPLASRGQKVTRLDLYPAGSRDWEPMDRAVTLRTELEKLQTRAAEAERERGTGRDERHEARIERQIAFYATQTAAAKSELDAYEKADRASKSTFAFSQIELAPEIADHPATRERVDAALARMGTTEGVDLAATWPRVAPDGSKYAGSDACTECHAVEAAQWATTPHARAWASLVASGRAVDRACTSCHVTGFDERGGPTGPSDVAGLQDVQCEACHGPSASHVDKPASQRPVRSPGAVACTTCHDNDRDMGRFDYGKYSLNVVHLPAEPVPAPGATEEQP